MRKEKGKLDLWFLLYWSDFHVLNRKRVSKTITLKNAFTNKNRFTESNNFMHPFITHLKWLNFPKYPLHLMTLIILKPEETEETQETNDQVAYEAHVMQVERVRQEMAQNDERYRNKMNIRGSVHQKKLAFEPGDKVAITSDHDNNQKTRKWKLEQICSMSEKVVSICNNNIIIRVSINGKVKNFATKIEIALI